MTYKSLFFWFLAFALGVSGLFSCHSVPDVPTKPLLTGFWDTVGRNKQILLPGDSILITSDLASQTKTNTLIFEAYRQTLPYVDYVGPDSDFVYLASKVISEKITTGDTQVMPIAKGVRPGNYRLLTRAKDNEGRFSDSVKSTFFLYRYDYPLLIMRLPSANGSKTAIVKDTARLAITALGNGLEYFQFQWFDSTNQIPFSEPKYRSLIGKTEGINLDTFLTTHDIGQTRMNLRIRVRQTNEREMLYWLPFKKSL